jgi:hypothetical protein
MKKIVYFILDTKISEGSVFREVYSSTCSTKELSITMTKIVHAVKGNSASSLKQQSAGRNVTPFRHIILIPSQPIFALIP